MPKISLMTPCFNAAQFVGEALASVAAQTVTDWEHVIVDDGSTDASADVVEAVCCRDSRVKLVRQTNRGVCAARNAGFRAACRDSQYLLFLDADDCLEPNMLEVLVGYLEARPNVGVAYCDFSRIDELGRPVAGEPPLPRYVPWALGMRKLPPAEPRTPLVSIVGGAPVLESLSVLRRSVYETTPGWCEELGQHGESVELFVRMALRSEVHFIPQSLYRYRRHPGQSSLDDSKVIRQDMRLREHLKDLHGVSASERRQVRDALRFCHYRAGPLMGFGIGWRHARQGNVLRGARFIGGAAWRYLASFWPVGQG